MCKSRIRYSIVGTTSVTTLSQKKFECDICTIGSKSSMTNSIVFDRFWCGCSFEMVKHVVS